MHWQPTAVAETRCERWCSHWNPRTFYPDRGEAVHASTDLGEDFADAIHYEAVLADTLETQ
ncbi:hypothetical protein GCM10011410_15450 [Hoyosella rhizosphaerae]|uniref:Uncharacterized protein n=1 Tax=Hoyosella rhizosphaerae TaxID=1755582 RepID=A0A916U8N5_9ACTN|nr:hypothetical protein GCM10011410_15450 [Hoyosella rhizosphaerae]